MTYSDRGHGHQAEVSVLTSHLPGSSTTIEAGNICNALDLGPKIYPQDICSHIGAAPGFVRVVPWFVWKANGLCSIAKCQISTLLMRLLWVTTDYIFNCNRLHFCL
ncbi:hypothetical protein BDM02DRAFT_3110456 [Thelephora ganbajun]|uniref:Uncharacterized protein n=1 Tax=Thelephora ganbajun TaxID=370292 RepID=A0ACB6ZQK0_THEGA|nr:hypothetical protein BDM02DRAFT_3110456 [Thelephora ganbajun]